MEKSSKLSFSDVISTTKDLCSCVTGDKYKVAYINLNLSDKGVLKEYTSVVACREEEYPDLVIDALSFDGCDKEKYVLDSKFCHIATFESYLYPRNPISFDMNDDCPIKAEINEEYGYLDAFFRRFIEFRNNLIENNQVVKEDDIYQYCLVVTEKINKRNKPKFKENIVKRLIKR